MFFDVISELDMKELGEKLGLLLGGGEVIELIGDVGSGKTTFVKGLAIGLGISDYVQSPSFTISRVYDGRDNLKLAHYDFYRLEDSGLMSDELHEAMLDKNKVVIIEWAGLVAGILPDDRLSIKISILSENSRRLEFIAGGDDSKVILEKIK
jgi:tRNA threonylcarbamoyladenosine biosynthesis protein TsaE